MTTTPTDPTVPYDGWFAFVPSTVQRHVADLFETIAKLERDNAWLTGCIIEMSECPLDVDGEPIETPFSSAQCQTEVESELAIRVSALVHASLAAFERLSPQSVIAPCCPECGFARSLCCCGGPSLGQIRVAIEDALSYAVEDDDLERAVENVAALRRGRASGAALAGVEVEQP